MNIDKSFVYKNMPLIEITIEIRFTQSHYIGQIYSINMSDYYITRHNIYHSWFILRIFFYIRIGKRNQPIYPVIFTYKTRNKNHSDTDNWQLRENIYLIGIGISYVTDKITYKYRR